MKLKENLYQAKQLILTKNIVHPTVILAMNFFKPVGQANMYVWFAYVPQKISIVPKDKYQDQLMLIQLI